MANHYRWVIVALTIINQAVITGIALYCFSIFSVPWVEQFEVSLSQLMIAAFALQLMNSMLSPLLGPRLDRVSLRLPVVSGFLVFAVGLGILAVANAYWQVVAVFAVLFPLSIVLAGTFASQLLINRWFTNDKGLAIGISATGTSFGGVLFPPLVATLLSSHSLGSIFVALAVFCLLVMLPLNFFVLRVESPQLQAAGENGSEAGVSSPVMTITAMIARPSFWIPLLLFVPVITAFSTVQFNWGTFLKDLEYPASFTAQVIALSSFMMIIGKLLYGRLADSVDHRWLMFAMGLMQLFMLVILRSGPSETQIMIAASLLGLSSGGLLPLLAMVYASRFDPNSFGRVMGAAIFFLAIQSVGSIYTGWMYDMLGNYELVFTSFIALIIPGLIIVKWLPRPLEKAAC